MDTQAACGLLSSLLSLSPLSHAHTGELWVLLEETWKGEGREV